MSTSYDVKVVNYDNVRLKIITISKGLFIKLF
jgi:hypothetical protein